MNEIIDDTDVINSLCRIHGQHCCDSEEILQPVYRLLLQNGCETLLWTPS